jgi:hypothetical protein
VSEADVEPRVEALWRAGELRAAVELSASRFRGGPFRDADVDAVGDDLDAAARLFAHGSRCWFVARWADAELALDRALAIRAAQLGDRDVATLACVERLAAVAHKQRRLADARVRWDAVVDALEIAAPVLGACAARNYAAYLTGRRGDLREPRELMDRALAVLVGELGEAHDDVLAARKANAMLLIREGAPRKALDAIQRALEDTALPDDHPFVAGAKLAAVRARLAARKPDAAAIEALLVDAIASFERGYGEHPLLAIALYLGAKHGSAPPEVAAERAARAFAVRRRFDPLPDRDTRVIGEAAHSLLEAAGLRDDAARLHRELAESPEVA